MNPIGWAKAHPVATGAAVIGGVILMVILMRGGGGGDTGYTAGSSSSVGGGTELALAQMGLQGQLAGQANELAAMKEQGAMQIELAKIGATSQFNLAELMGGIERERINAESQNVALVNTLQARVAEASIAADVTKSGHSLAAQQSTNETMYRIIASQQQTLQKQISKQCSGFFDCLF